MDNFHSAVLETYPQVQARRAAVPQPSAAPGTGHALSHPLGPTSHMSLGHLTAPRASRCWPTSGLAFSQGDSHSALFRSYLPTEGTLGKTAAGLWTRAMRSHLQFASLTWAWDICLLIPMELSPDVTCLPVAMSSSLGLRAAACPVV